MQTDLQSESAMAPELLLEQDPALELSAAIDTLTESGASVDPNKDMTLCFVCMQWSCDGIRCHREGICPPEGV